MSFKSVGFTFMVDDFLSELQIRFDIKAFCKLSGGAHCLVQGTSGQRPHYTPMGNKYYLNLKKGKVIF